MNSSPSPGRETWLGALYATLAYGAWGLMPVYWKWVGTVPPLQMVAHRVLWSVPVLLALVGLLGRSRELARALTSRHDLPPLLATAALISANWLIFIWAIQAGYILNASLGYYINPLLNILLGMVFLGERLRRVQTLAVVLAGLAVLNLTVALGIVPWISLALALTFGFYGLLRKTARVDGLLGLTVETL
ncbi:MAG: EamA family transporter RarD, partial [Candidatus Competibacteraceae bacterium]|nr:EamA family transporter RarD [Candidatus Competibacteraceae bacterium]